MDAGSAITDEVNESMNRSYDVAVVGGGPGGYTAALYCARAGLSVLVLEKLSAGGQMATTSQVENYPGFDEGVNGFDLGERMQRGAERFGAVTEYAEVTALALSEKPKRIVTSNGEFTAKAVVLAMGAYPKELGVPGESELRGNGVSYCAACDGMFYKGKTVIVAGGGNSAAEDAVLLSKLCKKVFLVHRRDTLRAEKSYLAPLTKAENVEFLWSTRITSLLSEGGSLRGVTLENVKNGESREVPCDGLFVAIGRQPDTALAAGQVQLDAQGYLAADETTRTSVPGVFAVGDIRSKPLRQIVTAAADGAVSSKFVQEYLLSADA